MSLNALSIVYMLVLLFHLRKKRRWETLNRLYSWIVVLICVFLALDLVYALLYGSTDAPRRFLLNVIKSCYFVANAAIVWQWARYVDVTIFGEQARRRAYHFVCLGVFLVNTAIVCVNSFTGILFRISPAGTFEVGRGAMWLFTLLNYALVFSSCFLLIRYRRRIKHSVFWTLLIFPLPPFLAELIQIFYRPCSLICTYAVSALIVFQVSQNNTSYTDELTGLANRRMLDETLRAWISARKGRTICGVMIDLDGLKRINDTYGHVSGDRALTTLAEMISGLRQRGLVCARYGGDEFLLLWRSKDGRELAGVEKWLENAKARVNAAKPVQERIEFSMGTFCCRDDEVSNPDEFLEQIDKNMYREKRNKRRDERYPPDGAEADQ